VDMAVVAAGHKGDTHGIVDVVGTGLVDMALAVNTAINAFLALHLSLGT
jgi:hypothetical protein